MQGISLGNKLANVQRVRCSQCYALAVDIDRDARCASCSVQGSLFDDQYGWAGLVDRAVGRAR